MFQSPLACAVGDPGGQHHPGLVKGNLLATEGQDSEKVGALSGGVSNVRFVPLAEKRQRLLVGLPAAAAVERMAERIVRIVRGARENRVTDAVKPGRRGAACGKMSHIQWVRLRPARNSASTVSKTGACAATKRSRLNESAAVIFTLPSPSTAPASATPSLARQVRSRRGLDLDFVTYSTRRGWKPGSGMPPGQAEQAGLAVTSGGGALGRRAAILF